MKNLEGKLVFITGATSGIGLACAEIFAGAKANLLLMARRVDRLEEISARLAKTYSIKTQFIVGDVRNYNAFKKSFDNLPEEWKNIDILINNAGLARGLEKVHLGSLSDWDDMIDTNIKGLLYSTKIVAPKMLERKTGHIFNIASVAGRMAYPGGNVYCATKSAVKSLSEAMRIDFIGTGVKVTNIDPGLVETEFSLVRFHGDKEKAEKPYQNYPPLVAEDIADAIFFAATRRDTVCIQDMLIMPIDQASPFVSYASKKA